MYGETDLSISPYDFYKKRNYGDYIMNKPKMIVFDYGQTLIKEEKFNGVAGIESIMKFAVENKYGKTPSEIQKFADEINSEIGRFNPFKRHLVKYEVSNTAFYAYLYESQGIKFSIPYEDLEEVFWDASSPGTATNGIKDFLQFLNEQRIRTGVISNISYKRKTVENRINRLIPNNQFEFIITSEEYVFRKPSKRIFDLALKKSGLKAGDVWYIGDQYECDIVGAKNAGMVPIWYNSNIIFQKNISDDVLKISEWNELRKILKNM